MFSDPAEFFKGRLDVWTEWIWKADPQQGPWLLLDISPHPEADLTDPADTRDWITLVGTKGGWFGPENLFRSVFRPCVDQPIEKGKSRPDNNPPKNPKKPKKKK